MSLQLLVEKSEWGYKTHFDQFHTPQNKCKCNFLLDCSKSKTPDKLRPSIRQYQRKRHSLIKEVTKIKPKVSSSVFETPFLVWNPGYKGRRKNPDSFDKSCLQSRWFQFRIHQCRNRRTRRLRILQNNDTRNYLVFLNIARFRNNYAVQTHTNWSW